MSPITNFVIGKNFPVKVVNMFYVLLEEWNVVMLMEVDVIWRCFFIGIKQNDIKPNKALHF